MVVVKTCTDAPAMQTRARIKSFYADADLIKSPKPNVLQRLLFKALLLAGVAYVAHVVRYGMGIYFPTLSCCVSHSLISSVLGLVLNHSGI